MYTPPLTSKMCHCRTCACRRSHDVCNTYQLVLRQDLCLSRGSSKLGAEGGTPERSIKIKLGIRRHLQEGLGCVQHISTRTASGLEPGAAPPSGKRQGIQCLRFPEIGLSTLAQVHPRQNSTNTGDQQPFETAARLTTAAGNQYE